MQHFATPEGAGVSRPQSNGKPPHGPHGATSTDAVVSFYENVLDSHSRQTYPLKTVLDKIRSCFWGERVNALRCETDPIKQDRLKKALPGATFAGTFDRRNKDSCTAFTGIVTLDFDAKDNTGERAALLSDIFPKAAEHESTLAAFISPRGEGAKILVRTDATIGTYPAAYKFVKAEYESLTGCVADKSGADIARLCFVSADPDAYINYEATALHVPPANVAPKPRNVAKRPAFADCQSLTDRADQWATADGGHFVEGNRHNWVFRFAGICNRLGVPSSDCRAWLHGAGRWFDDGDCERSMRDTYVKESHRHGEHAPRSQRPAVNIAVRRVNTLAAFAPPDDNVFHVDRWASEALDELEKRVLPGGRLLLKAPTGCGKTYALLNKEDGFAVRRIRAGCPLVVYLCPFANLVKQIEKDYGHPGVYGGQTREQLIQALASNIVVSTFDGLKKLIRDGLLPPGTVLIVDESHELSDGVLYRSHTLNLVCVHAEKVRVSGGSVVYVTATPGECFADETQTQTIEISPRFVKDKYVSIATGKVKELAGLCFTRLVRDVRAAPDDIQVVFCNSNEQLGILQAALISSGVAPDAIAMITAEHAGPAVDGLVNDQKFHPGILVVLATKALGAGYNVKNTNIGCVHLLTNGLEGLRPGDMAQYTARFRKMKALKVEAYLCENNPTGDDYGLSMAELLEDEKGEAQSNLRCKRHMPLDKVADHLPVFKLGESGRAVERTTDPNNGREQIVNRYTVLALAENRRARARSVHDLKTEWQGYDPGVKFVERNEPENDVDPATLAVLNQARADRKQAKKEARETVSSWDIRQGLTAAYHANPRLQYQLRKFDPRVWKSERPSDDDMAAFKLADGSKATQRLLDHQSDGIEAQELWKVCILESNPNKWATYLNSTALALHLEREAGTIGNPQLVDRYNAHAFDLWNHPCLPELLRYIADRPDGVNLKEAWKHVGLHLHQHTDGGVELSWHVFRNTLVPMHFDVGKQRKVKSGSGRVLVVPLIQRSEKEIAVYIAERYGIDWGKLVEHKRELRESTHGTDPTAADAKEAAPTDGTGAVVKERRLVPIFSGAAHAGVDVIFTDDPPDDETCPF